ncbi:MAG: type II toxin-antitoxin system RelE/ParE family toxin [Planctomycetaceae bacterium]
MSDPPTNTPDSDSTDGNPKLPYLVIYTYDAREHLSSLTAAQRSLVFDRIDQQLAHQPNVPTRNRKLLRPNPIATWELRIGELRVFYDLYETDGRVEIVAVGVKKHGILTIAGEKVQI